MADISKITLPNGNKYNIKDATARSIANGKSKVSVSQTITSGTEIATIKVNNNDTVLYIPDADSLIDAEVQELYDAEIGDE